MAAADVMGVSDTRLLSTEVLMLWILAVTTPFASVPMELTYFEPEPALTSQPQLLAPGAELPDW